LGFWSELHWTCGLLLIVQPFLLYWLCQSMCIGVLSTFVVFFDLFSVVCISPCRGHLHALLTLFLGIWFYCEAIVNGIVFIYSFLICLLYRKATDFYKLIWYTATIVKLFMVSRIFF
jgi:hypothetical protein